MSSRHISERLWMSDAHVREPGKSQKYATACAGLQLAGYQPEPSPAPFRSVLQRKALPDAVSRTVPCSIP